MLDDDDLEYDSMDGEEEDYDEVPEMDSLEQPAVDGELPCTHLALRVKPLGETMELPQVLLGWCLLIQLGSGSLCHLSGGIGDLQPSRWYLGGCTFSITVLSTPCRPCALPPSPKPSPAVGWWDLLPWQISCALVMSHRRDPKGPRRSGKPQWQQPLESPSTTLPRGAVAIMSPFHLPPSSLLGAAPGRQLAQSGVSCPQFQQLGRAQRWLQPNPSHAQLGAIPCLPLPGFPLLCQVGLAASTAGVLPAPACPHQQRFPAAEPCRLPLDEGDCQRYTLRWYYNQRVTECRPFVYSGCRGNLNRFGSKEECELHCGQRPGAGRQSWAQLGTGRSSSIPTPCRGLSNAELGGQC